MKFMIIAIVILAVLVVGAVIVINKVKNSNIVAEKATIEEYGYNIYSYDRNSDPVYYMHGYSCVKKTIENNLKTSFATALKNAGMIKKSIDRFSRIL